jgi:hypothetical protein
MASVRYINGIGENQQYNYRYYDNITDSTRTNIDLLVSPDEIDWFYKKDGNTVNIKMSLPGRDNLRRNNDSILSINT